MQQLTGAHWGWGGIFRVTMNYLFNSFMHAPAEPLFPPLTDAWLQRAQRIQISWILGFVIIIIILGTGGGRSVGVGEGLLIYYAFCWSRTCSYSPSNFKVSQSLSEERRGFTLDVEVGNFHYEREWKVAANSGNAWEGILPKHSNPIFIQGKGLDGLNLMSSSHW